MPTVGAVLGADRLRRPEALVGVGRRHPDVDDRDVRAMLADRPPGGRRRRRPGRRPRSRPRPAAARCPRAGGPSRRRGRAAGSRASRPGRGSPAPESSSLGMKPSARPVVEARPVGARVAARGQHDERRRSVDGELAGDLEALDIGQPDVEQDEIRPERPGGREARGAVVGLADTTKPSASRRARAWTRKPAWSSTMRMVFMRRSCHAERRRPTGLTRSRHGGVVGIVAKSAFRRPSG